MGKRLPKHLIIPDPHSHAEHDNDRFEALGNFIVEARPDVVICIGDFADMSSLSSYDKGTKGFEGRRYQRDIDAAIDANERLWAPLNKGAKKGIRPWTPRKVMCLGNHENRIDRLVNAQAELDGKVSMADLQYERFGWEVVPFLTPIEIDTISYCHYFVSGVAGRAISGENIGKAMCNKLHVSAVQGHSHIFDHSERSLPTGRKIFGLSCGCFVHPEMIEGWNLSFVHMWWAGVVVLEDLDGRGYYDSLVATTQRKLMRDYL
jgi:hypothetical protein